MRDTKGFITSSIAGKICTSRVARTSTRPKLSVVYQLPGIVEAAIVGVPDPEMGESGVAVVVLEPDSILTGEVDSALC